MKNSKWLLLAIIVTLLLVGFEFYSAIFSGYYISGDNRSEYFPLYSFYDQALFSEMPEKDILFSYLPLGFIGLCYVLSKIISLYAITIFLPFLFSLIIVFFFFRITRFFSDKGWIRFLFSFIFMLMFLSSDLGRGGTLKSLGLCFILAFLYYFLKRERIKAYFVTILSCWFYPLVLGICVGAAVLDVICNTFQDKEKKRKLVINFLIFIVILFFNLIPVIKSHVFFPFSEKSVTHFTQEEIQNMPEFGPEGAFKPTNRLNREIGYIFSLNFLYDQLLYIDRYDYEKILIWPLFLFILAVFLAILKKKQKFDFNSSIVRKKIFILAGLTCVFFCSLTMHAKVVEVYGALVWLLLSVLLIFLILLGRRVVFDLPRKLWYVLVASVGMFIFIYCMPYDIVIVLHLPTRQLALCMPVFLVLTCCHSFDRMNYSRALGPNLKNITMIAGVLLLSTYLVNYDSHLRHAKDEKLYQYLETLPKDILVAGHPEQMDNILFFGKREVLSCLEFTPYYGKKYWPFYKERMFDSYNALYSQDYGDFREFCRKYKDRNIYFVIDKFYLSDTYLDGPIYYEPFASYIRSIAQDRNFFLECISEDKILFDDNNVFVVHCQDFLQ
ncbi:MAG: hypothetical protein GY853_03930 [PVC group bacterium]|nr:hypothetical protein [PVC group bacterium]